MSTVASELRGFEIGTSRPGTTRPLSNAFWKWLAAFGVLLSDMSFLEHLEELRSRLIKSVIAIGVCVFVCTAYTPAIVRFLKAPAAKYGVELVGYGGWEMFSLYFDVAFADRVLAQHRIKGDDLFDLRRRQLEQLRHSGLHFVR